MQNKNVLITGGGRGMGKVTAKEVAERGGNVIIVDWEGEESTRTRDAINQQVGREAVEFIYCDLSSMGEVKQLVEKIIARWDKLDVLVNNAGITDPVRRLSRDGYEMHLATCHLGHYILTHGLLDLLKAAGNARIVQISSDAHKAGPGLDFDDFNNEAIWGKHAVSNNAAFKAYHRAKICNIYMMQELSARLAPFGICVNAVSPGYFINTTIHRNTTGIFKWVGKLVFGWGTVLGLNTPERGARSHIFLTCSPEAEGITGKYFEHAKEKAMGKPAEDREAREKLWALSEKITGLSFPPANLPHHPTAPAP